MVKNISSVDGYFYDFSDREEELAVETESTSGENYQSYWQKQYALHREEKKLATRIYNQDRRNAAVAILGNMCKRCGFNDPRALQVDHINGGGSKDKKNITRHYYNVVIESVMAGEKKYQLLCANCNWIKRAEKQEVAGYWGEK